MNDLFDIMEIEPGSDAGIMTMGPGIARYSGNLTYWTNNTWYLSFPDPDNRVGYLTFTATRQDLSRLYL